jgi:MSHA biogenesis protein MshQ
MRRQLLGLVMLGIAAPSAFAGTCSSAATGNWNVASTWGAGCTGAGGIPAAADNVTISNGNTVTVTASSSVTSVTMAGGTANNVFLNLNSGVTLTVSGGVTFTASTSNTRTRRITVASTGQLQIGGNLTINTGSVTGSVADIAIATGAAVTVAGSITYTGTVAPSITVSGTGNLTVGGDFSNGLTFTPASGTVTYNGSGAQNLGTYTYNNLVISKSGGGATATASASAATLQFAAGNAGIVTVSSGTLTVTGTCPGAVSQTGSGWVNGNLRLTFGAGSQTCTFPIGDATNYSPLTIATTGANGGTLTADVTNAIHPQNATWPLSTTKYVNRYWTLGAATDTLTVTSYNATMNWVAGDIQGGANYQNFIVGEYQGGWLVPNPSSSSNTATSIVATGITTAFTTAADLVVGEPFACLPPASAPVPLVCQCDNFGRSNLNPSTIYNSNWLLSTSSGSFGLPKIVNQSYLRLTDNTGNNATAATVPGIFPAAGNYISVEFKQYAYNGTGADGIAMTLSDYSIAPTPGAYGGSLGYAQKTGINGFAGGWIGVALDEYGNYSNPTEGRVTGPGFFPESVGVRGSGSGTTGYPWLAGALSLGANTIDNRASTAPKNGYLYQVIVDARNYTAGTHTASVSVNRDTTGTGNSYANLVAPFDAYVVNASQAPVPVNWQISFTGSTGGSTNIHEIGNLKVCAQTFIPPTSNGTAAGFNAIDSALPNTKQNALFGHIYMKLANVPFTLNVAALLPPVGGVSQGVNTVYVTSGSKNVTVKLIDDSQAGTSCNSSASACTNCSKTVITSQTVNFTSADAGFKTSPAFTVPNAYKRVIAQMNDGTTTGCSTDAFSVRPAWYALSSSVSSATKAGTSFTITATPKNPSNATVTGATGSPVLDNTKAPTAGGNQTLLMQSWNAGASFGTFIYNDVGNFTLPVNAIYDAQFGNAAGEAQDRTNGDCNPGSGTPYVPIFCYGYSGASCTNLTPWSPDSSGKYSCDIGSAASPSIGRFYPDHYEASLAMTQGCSTDAFTYMGQPFSMTSSSSGAIQVKALAAGQTFATAPGLPSFTTGYSNLSTLWFGAQDGLTPATDLIKCISSAQNTSPNRCALTTLPFKTAASNAWINGVYTAPATTFYFDPPKDATTTPDATWGPYDSLNVGITVLDSDSSTLTIPAGQSFLLNGDTYQRISGSSPTKQRYGRMRIQNAAGSEQVPLAVPVFVEYWNGTGWTPNTLDATCTRLATTPTAYGGNTAAASCFGTGCTAVSSGSVGSIYTSRVQAVGANAVAPLSYSSPQFSFGQRNVTLSAPKASGTLGLSVEVPAWLKLGPNDPTGVNPSATIRFGTYNSRFIFLRENY